MKLVCTGVTGFVGATLLPLLIEEGHEVLVLTRNTEEALKHFENKIPENELKKVIFYAWKEVKGHFELPLPFLENVEGVIHLAGENVSEKKWSLEVKKRIIQSRVDTIKKLSKTFEHSSQLKFFISASAIGFYGDRADEELDEKSSKGQGFLSDVCQQWEEALLHTPLKCRKISLRIGLVLGANGGALKKILPLFRYGFGGKLGKGHQWMSWIHIQDLVRFILFAIQNEKTNGIYNVVSPHPIKNSDFTKTLSQFFQKPAIFHAPKIVLKLALGDMASLLLSSQKVYPKKMLEEGFLVQFKTLHDVLRDVVKK